MPKSQEETVMLANENKGLQELHDRPLAYSSTKQSIQMSESKKTTRNDDPMNVDALSKGSGKGKSKGKGKKGESKGEGNGKLNDAESSNWQKVGHDRLADKNWFRMVDDSKRLDTLGKRRTSRAI